MRWFNFLTCGQQRMRQVTISRSDEEVAGTAGQGLVGEDAGMGGYRGALAVTAQCQKHQFKEPASWPTTETACEGRLGVCVTQREHVYSTCTKNNKCISFWTCVFACTRSWEGRGRGLILIISCQALGLALQTRWCKSKCVSGSCVCVCVAALPLREQAKDQCQILPPAVFLARPQGHFKTHTHVHACTAKSETFRYRHLHKSDLLEQHTLVLTLMHV